MFQLVPMGKKNTPLFYLEDRETIGTAGTAGTFGTFFTVLDLPS
jgi:hypothetical protein